MQIREINQSETDTYFQLAESLGSVFNSQSWLQLYGGDVKLIGIYDKQEKLIGGFHYFVGKRGFLKHINNPPFTPNMGLFFNLKSQNPAKRMSEQKAVMNALASYFIHLKPGILTIAFQPKWIDMQAYIWKGFKVIPNYTYQMDLAPSMDEISKGFSPEKRNEIKKAEKDGVVIKPETDYSIVKQLVLKTYDRQNVNNDLELLDRILFEFAKPENSFAFVAWQDDKPVSCSFCIYDNNTAYYLLGGYDDKRKHSGAGSLVLKNAIKHAKEIGLEVFDFEGSMLQEVEKFFRAFGGKLVPYYTLNLAKLPVEIALKFIKRSQF
jgi:lipid II:glycine glycyltransferase (peptidoglycan interpeptide bridge formation enzyme)